jgi:rhomboid protease GluP
MPLLELSIIAFDNARYHLMNENPVSPPAPRLVPPPREVRVSLPVSAPNVTYVIIGITVFVYILQLASVYFYGYAVNGVDWLELFGARINSFIRAGQVWRFFTPALLHGSPPHIFFNMYGLVVLGPLLERHFGHKRFLLLYMLTAFSGNVLSFILGDENGYSVGASTAIFGLVAAEGVFFFQNKKMFGDQAKRAIGNVAFIILANLFLGLAPGIDNWGHVGGLLGGLIFTWYAGPRWQLDGLYPNFQLKDSTELREIVNGASIVLLLFGLLAVWGMFFG